MAGVLAQRREKGRGGAMGIADSMEVSVVQGWGHRDGGSDVEGGGSGIGMVAQGWGLL